MFGFLKNLFVRETAPPAVDPDDQFRRLDQLAPLRDPSALTRSQQSEAGDEAAAERSTERSFVCRETILSRDERIAGYEFSLSRQIRNRLLARSETVQRVYDDALLRNLDSTKVGELLGHRLAFAHLSPLSISNPLLDTIAATNLVLLLDPRAIAEIDATTVRQRLAALREHGVRHGWVLRRDWTELLPLFAASDFVQIDASAFDGLELGSMAVELRKLDRGSDGPIQIVGRNLQTHEDFHLCYQYGFDLFQGVFVSSRENWQLPKSDINRLRLIELLNMIRAGAEFDAISETLKTEPVVTFKLMRYINSPAVGLQSEVKTIGQGLIVLGRDKFYRWLSLLLFDSKNPGYRERLLTEQALTRGRFMECLAGHGHLPAVPEHLFMTGLFSLLDALMGQTMADMLKNVTLPEAVSDALLGRPGVMRDALRLAMATESNDAEEVAPAADRCGVSDDDVCRASLDALTWVQSISGAAAP